MTRAPLAPARRLTLVLMGLALPFLFRCATGKDERKSAEGPPSAAERGKVDLTKLNDEELLALGTAASASGNFAQAAEAFGHLAEAFPHSKYRRAALINAGAALEQLEAWDAAAKKFSLLANPRGGPEEVDATFHLAEALYHLERYGEASDLLASLSNRSDLAPNQKLMALVQQGVCDFEAGKDSKAEALFREVLTKYQELKDPKEVDLYHPAQAAFFLGELFRQRYEMQEFPTHASSAKLRDDLELKAQLLLSAEGHYLRTIRLGHPRWATAAGLHIGEMYEHLFKTISELPDPEELRPEDVRVFRQEVRNRIRILLTKAISVYESTLEMAERTGESNPFVDRTKEGLTRMKNLLLTEDGSEGPAPP